MKLSITDITVDDLSEGQYNALLSLLGIETVTYQADVDLEALKTLVTDPTDSHAGSPAAEPTEAPAPPMENMVPPPPLVATAPPPPAADVEVDSVGVAWDETLHASSKAKNADGTWRKRRGAPAAPPADMSKPEAWMSAPAAPPAPPAAPEGDGVSFMDLMRLVTAKQAAGVDTMAAFKSLGYDAPPQLQPDDKAADRKIIFDLLNAPS